MRGPPTDVARSASRQPVTLDRVGSLAPKKVAEVMKNALKRDAVASTVSSYERIFDGSQAGGTERRKAEYKRFTNKY